jgi:hypothetical protein
MNTMKILLAGALCAATATGAGCKPDAAKRADRAAHHLVNQDEHLRTAQTQLDEGESADRVKVAEHEDDVSRAADEFAVRRNTRIERLRGEHAGIATQSGILQTLVDALPLSDEGRSQASERLTVFQMRLDDTAHAIEALQTVPASEFTDRDDAISKAMSRLEDARKAAWKALTDAPRIDQTSSL